MKVLKKIWNNLEGSLCVISLVIMLIALTIQVFARFIFSTGTAWSEELSRYCLIWLIFISASYAAQTNSHIRVDMVINLYPKAWRPWVERLSDVIWMAFTIVLAIRGYAYVMGIFSQNQSGVALHIKLGWVYLSIPFGYTLMSIRLIENFVKSFIEAKAVTNE